MLKEGVNKQKLFTLNFLLLWQGQFVSVLGDVIYEVALGFWVLEKTGSTALMGTFMAVTVLPKVVVSPFAGVFVDRHSRKMILFLADLFRGVSILLVGIAALMGYIEVWMLLVVGVVMGTCAAFFSPAINSTLPDIVPKDKLVKANSIFSTLYAAGTVLGYFVGGVLYRWIKAPLMFLFNGISYIFSSITTLFIHIPKTKNEGHPHFWRDMQEGFRFIWKFSSLRNAIFAFAVLNFLFNVAFILLVPFFNKTEGLGAGRYGIALGFAVIGMLLGMVYTSVFDIRPSRRFLLFTLSTFIYSISYGVFPIADNFYVMVALLLIGGIFLAIINVLFNSSIQITVPKNMRGKVFALLNLLTRGLTPVGWALGGILGEFFPLSAIMVSCFAITFLLFIPLAFSPSFKEFINYDEEKGKNLP